MIDKNLLPTEADVRFYEENGYWKSKKVISEERLVKIRAAMDDVYAMKYETGRAPWSSSWKPGDDPKALRKTDNSWWASDTLRDLATDVMIGAIASRLTGSPEIRLWHDQLLYKPGGGPNAARTGANVGWHQDLHYWQCSQGHMLTAWVAFDDVPPEKGAMQVVPGSHKWGLLEESDFFSQDLDEMRRKIEEHTGQEFKTAYCDLKAGEVSFHHCLTLHGSGPNTTDTPRRSVAIHLMTDDCCYVPGTSSDEHMNVILLKDRGMGPEMRFKGDLWPVLYSEVEPAGV